MKGFNLTSIPAEVFTVKNLKTLILSSNPLSEISPSIAQLQELRSLHLGDCQLTSEIFPKEFGSLKLEELNLAHNMLTDIQFLTSIKCLKRLNLMGNELLDLPVEVGRLSDHQIRDLKELKILNLAKNNISDISMVMDALSEVQVLVVHHNRRT